MEKIIISVLFILSFNLFGNEDTQTVLKPLMKVSATGGLSYGAGDGYEYTSVRAGINLGGIFTYGLSNINEKLSLEGEINYSYYSGDTHNDWEYSFGMLEFLAGGNYNFSPNISVIGGLGFYRFFVEVKYTGSGPGYSYGDSSETYLGIFFGSVYDLGNRLSIRGTIHLPDFDSNALYIRLNIAYSFDI